MSLFKASPLWFLFFHFLLLTPSFAMFTHKETPEEYRQRRGLRKETPEEYRARHEREEKAGSKNQKQDKKPQNLRFYGITTATKQPVLSGTALGYRNVPYAAPATAMGAAVQHTAVRFSAPPKGATVVGAAGAGASRTPRLGNKTMHSTPATAHASRYKAKETPEEYRMRQEKNAQKREKREQYRKTLEQQAEALGLPSYGDIHDLKSRIRQKRQEQYKKKLEQEAAALGLSSYGDINTLKSKIRQKQYEERQEQVAKALGLSLRSISMLSESPKSKSRMSEKDIEQYEERQKQYKKMLEQEAEALRLSFYGNINSPNNAILAKRTLKERQRKRLSYQESSVERNSNDTGYSSSLGRMVGDGRGGMFFAPWGKDDN